MIYFSLKVPAVDFIPRSFTILHHNIIVIIIAIPFLLQHWLIINLIVARMMVLMVIATNTMSKIVHNLLMKYGRRNNISKEINLLASLYEI